MSDKILDVFNKFVKLSTEIVEETKDPITIAACSIQLGMMIYKTVLTEEEYDIMAEGIYQMRGEISKFEADSSLQIH